MAEPFLGEIRLFALDYAPKNWSMCDGQIMALSENPALFSLLGTTYGGNGQTTFALPNLNGRVPIHYDPPGKNISLGQAAGTEFHTLSMQEMAAHMHRVSASTQNANKTSPSGNVWAAKENSYSVVDSSLEYAMHPTALSAVGGSQPHENRQPFLVLNFCICVNGIFPPRS